MTSLLRMSIAAALLAGASMTAVAQDPAAAPAADVFTITDASGATLTGDVAAGEKVFKTFCTTCHSPKAGENRVGPSLFGIVGRVSGSVEGFRYSKANREANKTWTEQELFTYLENPRASIPGTTMAFVGLKKPQDRANIIAYLRTLK